MQRSNSLRELIFLQARQDSNLQPPVLERTPSNAGVEAFVDFQGLSSGPPTPALLDNAGVGTIPATERRRLLAPYSARGDGPVSAATLPTARGAAPLIAAPTS